METLATVIVVFILAGLVKGVSGMGLPTVSIALLSLFIPPAQAAMLMVMPSLATNLAQCWGPHGLMLFRKLGWLWGCLAFATIYSPLPDISDGGSHATLFLGVVLVTYSFWGLFKPQLPRLNKSHPVASALVGGSTGIITAATGVFVLPMVPYMQLLGLSKEAFIQGLGIGFTIATMALAARLGLNGSFDLPNGSVAIGLAVLSAFAGLWLGSMVRDRLNPVQFQKSLYIVLGSLGLAMIVRAA